MLVAIPLASETLRLDSSLKILPLACVFMFIDGVIDGRGVEEIFVGYSPLV